MSSDGKLPSEKAAAGSSDVDKATSALRGVTLTALSSAVPLAGDSDDEGGVESSDPAATIKDTDEMLKLLKQPGLDEAILAATGARPKPAATRAVTASDMLAPAVRGGAGASTATEGGVKAHKFWDTQPVPKLGASVSDHGPIDDPKTVTEVKAEPYPLPPGFEWVTIDVSKAAQLKEMYELLRDHYVEDDENMFRFNYSAEFLLWALTPPHYFSDWHVGVRKAKTGALVACITGVPANMRAYEHQMVLCEINFLCVHKSLRSKRLAPVLIKEVTRRVNLQGIFQAAYTAGVVLPKPVSSCQYWHRSINPKKLIDVGFSRLAPRMTMNRTIRLYDLPATPKIPGVRKLVAADVTATCALLNTYLSKFKLAPVFSEDEFVHWMLPRAGVIDSFVVEDPESHEITDFISFYHLPSTILGHDKHKELSAVYAYYNVFTKHTLREVMEDSLILAKQVGVDVFNCLDLMNNGEVVKDLKFGPGDGHLQYYLFNWRCPEMKPEEVGLVLL